MLRISIYITLIWINLIVPQGYSSHYTLTLYEGSASHELMYFLNKFENRFREHGISDIQRDNSSSALSFEDSLILREDSRVVRFYNGKFNASKVFDYNSLFHYFTEPLPRDNALVSLFEVASHHSLDYLDVITNSTRLHIAVLPNNTFIQDYRNWIIGSPHSRTAHYLYITYPITSTTKLEWLKQIGYLQPSHYNGENGHAPEGLYINEIAIKEEGKNRRVSISRVL